MSMSGDDVNLGNPCNGRRDAEERNDAKVTHADHPVSESGVVGKGRGGADDLFDDTVTRTPGQGGRTAPERTGAPSPGAAAATGEVETRVAQAQPPAGTVPPTVTTAPGETQVGKAGWQHADIHAETVHDPELDFPGERTSHVDPLSGDTGIHPVGVGVGATAGGAVAGAVAGLAGGVVAGPLGAALGAALGTTLGAIGGGYTGKHVAERVYPTTEDHYWRHAYSARPYVPKGTKYEAWEPAYEYGIDMREWLIDKTWEEAEPVIKSGWEESDAGKKMPWETARPAIMDSWDHLTPEPSEQEVTEEERERD